MGLWKDGVMEGWGDGVLSPVAISILWANKKRPQPLMSKFLANDFNR